MNYKEALIKIQNICSKQEKCILDIKLKLNEWQVTEENQEKIMKVLINEKYIDEQRYIRAFTKDRLFINKWGKIKIKYHLNQKGLKNEDIENIFNEINMDDYYLILEQLLKGKIKSIKSDNKKAQYRKLVNFAYNRGFSFEESHKIIQQLLK